MTPHAQSDTPQSQTSPQRESEIQQKPESEKILCNHCKRTATNGIKCQGICVADSAY